VISLAKTVNQNERERSRGEWEAMERIAGSSSDSADKIVEAMTTLIQVVETSPTEVAQQP